MKSSQLMEQLEDVRRFDQRVIVIGQHAPGDRPGGVLLKQLQQGGGETVHALRGKPDVVSVLIAGGGDEEMEVTVIGPVRRSVPRTGISLAPGEHLLALLGRELSPEVTGRGHGQWHGVPALAGGASFLSSALNIPKVIVFACVSPAKAGTPYLISACSPAPSCLAGFPTPVDRGASGFRLGGGGQLLRGRLPCSG